MYTPLHQPQSHPLALLVRTPSGRIFWSKRPKVKKYQSNFKMTYLILLIFIDLTTISVQIYRVSIKSFSYYKHLLQENCVEYKHIFFLNVTQIKKDFLETKVMVKKYVYIPRSFLVINVCNQGKTLCSPCICLYSTYFSCNKCL